MTPNQEEFRIHKAMVDYLLSRVWKGQKLTHEGQPAFESLLVIHVPNSQHGEDQAAEGFFKKQMGALPGAYDFLFFWPTRSAAAYDVKAKGGTLTPAQKRFRERWENAGFPCAHGSTVEHLRDTLIGWGAKCRIRQIQEPDLRTDQQKKKDSFDFYAPPNLLP